MNWRRNKMKGEIKKEATREGRKNDMKPTVKKDAK